MSFFQIVELFIQVKELGNPKGKKPKDVPQHYEVCEPCKIHLDQGTEIPLALLSRLIKYKLLAIKDKDVKRREQEKKVNSLNNFQKRKIIITTIKIKNIL